jgi:hypothetical protein
LKIVYCLPVIVLFGVLAMRASSAEEAGNGSHNDGQPAAQADSANPAGERGPAAGGGNAKDFNTAAPGGNSADDIDTRITVQSHRRPGAKQNKLGEVKTRINSALVSNSHRRMFHASAASGPIVRNAVSMPVVQHGSVERGDGKHLDTIGAPRPAAALTSEVPTGGFARAGMHFEQTKNDNPNVGSTAVNRGTINGTGLIHRNTAGISGLGGPTTAVAGINGTTIRPKH